MTLFEYMSVAISIIIALAVAEVLRSLKSALDPGKRYSIHVTWIFIKLANPVFYWWSLWGIRDFPEAWNMATFTWALIVPSIIYLQVHSLVSSDPDKINDWRQHFYNQRKWFFGLNMILAASSAFSFTYFFISAPPKVVPITAYTLIFILSLAGFRSDNARLHAVIAATVAAFTFIYWWIIAFQPFSLT